MARMSLHYHGLPITPLATLYTLAGRCFCVSFAHPAQVRQAHEIGQTVMLDNGAFSAFKKDAPITDWAPYYAWADRWLDYPTTWAVIPDEIAGDDARQDALVADWPHGERGAPVWHMHESIERLVRLTEAWPRVCIGSSGAYWQILSSAWTRRMDDAWDALAARHARTPNIHMLRGMQLSRCEWPFASVDSTDIARNHNRAENTARGMADRWDAGQCPATWRGREQNAELFA